MARIDSLKSIDTTNLGKKSTRGGIVNVIGQLFSVLLQLVSTIILARIINPSSYGLIGMVMTIIVFAGLFKDLGLSTATIQRKDLTKKQVSVMFWVNILVGFTLWGLIAICAPLAVWFYAKPQLYWITVILGFNIFLSSLGAQHAALLNRNMAFLKLNIVKISSALMYFIVALIGALNDLEYWALVLAAVSQSATYTILVWVFTKWKPGLPQRNTGSRQMIKYGLNITGFEFVNYFSRNLDNIVIGKFLGAEILGYYSRAYRLIMFPIGSIRTPLASVALPALSSIQSEQLRFKSYYIKLLSILSLITMPIAALTYVASKPIVLVLLGPNWLPVVPMIKWLAIAAFLQPVAGLFGVVLMALGLAKRHMYCGLISGVVLSLTFIVSVNYGIEILTIAYAASGYILFIPIFLYASKGTNINLTDFLKGVWRPAVASISTVLLINLFDFLFAKDNYYLLLTAMSLVFLIIYFSLLGMLPGGMNHMRIIIKQIRVAFNSK